MTEMIESKEVCRDCSQPFLIPKQRGRPPVRCGPCKEIKDAELAGRILKEDPEKMYSGPKWKLKGTPDERPQGREAQCVVCGRIFSSYYAADLHKTYTRDNSPSSCKDPVLVGMVPRMKRNIPIWVKPNDREF